MKTLTTVRQTFRKHKFLFEELVKRDFKQKYKRTVLGMGWSILSPLCTMLVLNFIFGHIFGRSIPNYAIYLLCGNLLFYYFKEATSGGMNSLMNNAAIFTKVNVPKYLFLLSKNISALINFGLTMCILMVFIIFNRIEIGWHFLALFFPTTCLVLLNIGVGLILSAWFVFYRDIGYLYDVFTLLLMYGSAIFYDISIVPARFMFVFYCNPVWVYINYFREVILHANIPSLQYHALCIFYALIFIAIGGWIYKKNNHKFLYYI